jgi:hypothetical protein
MRAKGAAILTRLQYLHQQASPVTAAAVLGSLPEAYQALFTQGIRVDVWYPMLLLDQLSVAMDRALGRGDGQLFITLGRYSAEQVYQGIFRMFFKLGSPEFVLKQANHLYRQYYDSGQLQIDQHEPNQARVELKELPQHFPSLCPTLFGWSVRVIELCGGEFVQGRMLTQNHETGECAFLVNWR